MPKAGFQVKFIFLIPLVSLIVRIALFFFAPDQYLAFGDTPEYLETSSILCGTGKYPFTHLVLPTYRAPGFPLFLALISGCFYIPPSIIPILLSVLDSLSCLVGMSIVFKLSTRHKHARSALFGIAYAFYPPFIQQSISVQSEVLTQFSLLLSYFFLGRLLRPAQEKISLLSAFFGGAGIGVAILTRPSALVLLLMLAGGVVLGSRQSRGFIVTVLLGAAAVLLPWSTYATINTGKLTLVNDSFCYSAYRGARLELLDVYQATSSEAFSQAALHSEQAVREAEQQIAVTDWCKETLKLLAQNPQEELKLALIKLAVYFRPWPHLAAHRPGLALATGLIISLLYLFFITAVCQRNGNRALKLMVIAFMLIVGILHVPHQVSNRYRIPFVDPLMMIMAAAYFKLPARRSRPEYPQTDSVD